MRNQRTYRHADSWIRFPFLSLSEKIAWRVLTLIFFVNLNVFGLKTVLFEFIIWKFNFQFPTSNPGYQAVGDLELLEVKR